MIIQITFHCWIILVANSICLDKNFLYSEVLEDIKFDSVVQNIKFDSNKSYYSKQIDCGITWIRTCTADCETHSDISCDFWCISADLKHIVGHNQAPEDVMMTSLYVTVWL